MPDCIKEDLNPNALTMSNLVEEDDLLLLSEYISEEFLEATSACGDEDPRVPPYTSHSPSLSTSPTAEERVMPLV